MFFSTTDLCLYIVILVENKTGPICLALMGLTAGWLVDEMWMEVKIFITPYRLNYPAMFNISALLL